MRRLNGPYLAMLVLLAAVLPPGCMLDRMGLNANTSDPGSSSSSGGGSGGGEPEQVAVYVSALGNDNASGESPSEPLATIGAGIDRALACPSNPCEVRIAAGTYTGAVTLAQGVDLIGGYAPDFSALDVESYEVLITSTQDKTVVANAISEPTRLEGLHIVGASFAQLPDGKSTYAVWVSSSTEALTVVDSILEGGVAAAGAQGADGTLSQCAVAGGSGGEAYDCGGSKGSAGSAGGDPKVGGEGGDPGSSNCPSACPLVGGDGVSEGKVGQPGGDGDAGSNGSAAANDLGSFSQGAWLGDQGMAGGRGKHGTSGGGAGSGGSKRFKACFGCGTLLGGRGGDGSAGGCGGLGGEAGTPGGGSFALVLDASKITLDGVTLVGGKGGNGGKGGDGHDGQAGQNDGEAGRQGAASQKCGALNYNSGGGGKGGSGGDGGPGGGGSGGIGGVSIGIALLGSASVVELSPSIFQIGEGGQGGLGGKRGDAQDEAQAGKAGAAEAKVSYEP